MDLKPGYKQTEVGVIPEEWEVTTIGDVCTFSGGSQPPRFTFKFVQTQGYIRLIQIRDYKSDDFASYIPEPLARKRCTTEDIMIGRYGPPIFQILRGIEGAYNVALIKATPAQKVDRDFFYNVLKQEPLFQVIEALSRRTSGQTGVEMPALKSYGLPLPPLLEQRAIATALSDVDALLAALDRLIAKQRDLKQAAMQQLLTGQTRLPGFKGEWETKTLFELAERKKELFDDGDWIESEHITTEGIRLIQTGNIGVGRFTEKDAKKYIYEKSFISLRCKQLRQGDLLVCRLADPAGRACVLPDIGEERVVTSVDVTIFRPPPEVANRVFLANVFSTPEWFRAVSDRSGGTTHKRISRGALSRISITLPPLPEQTAIAAVLTDMDAKLSALEQRRDKTRALKQGMMQELLTGRTRLL